jgi:hypothetical protein
LLSQINPYQPSLHPIIKRQTQKTINI